MKTLANYLLIVISSLLLGSCEKEAMETMTPLSPTIEGNKIGNSSYYIYRELVYDQLTGNLIYDFIYQPWGSGNNFYLNVNSSGNILNISIEKPNSVECYTEDWIYAGELNIKNDSLTLKSSYHKVSNQTDYRIVILAVQHPNYIICK